jgi:hypothetical protein
MNEIAKFAHNIPMPKIARMDVVDHLVIRVTWSEGIRANRTDTVDLSPMINTLKHYRPLRDDQALFRTAHLIENGRILAWGDNDQIDMAADSIEGLAEETMAADDFRDFLVRYSLTHNEAAAQLGRSRRQVENYLSGSEPIPRVVVMACFGLVARKQFLRGPVTKVTIMDRLSKGSTGTAPASWQRAAITGGPVPNIPETSAA